MVDNATRKAAVLFFILLFLVSIGVKLSSEASVKVDIQSVHSGFEKGTHTEKDVEVDVVVAPSEKGDEDDEEDEDEDDYDYDDDDEEEEESSHHIEHEDVAEGGERAPEWPSLTSGDIFEWKNFPNILKLVEQHAPSLCRDGILQELWELKNMTAGGVSAPVVVGGVGDSGTRSLVDFLHSFHVDFSKVSRSRDSRAYMTEYKLPSCDDPTVLEGTHAYHVYMNIWPHEANFSFTRSPQVEKDWWRGLRYIINVLKKQHRLRQSPNGLWGIKQPRITMLLRFFKELYGDQLRYIHVVRDFRDLASGARKFFYRQVCWLLYKGDEERRVCSNTLKNRIEFNSRYTIDSIQWLHDNLKPEQFIVVRIEDLVSGDIEALRRLTNFMKGAYGDNFEFLEETLKEQRDSFHDHVGSYGGLKHPPAERRRLNLSSKIPAVTAGMNLVEYRLPEEDDGSWTPLTRWTCALPVCHTLT